MRLFRCPHRIFITSLRWPRDTVEMQGIELVAIFSLLSSLFSLFSAPSSLLSSALDSRNRIPAFLQGIMRPRGVLHCKNAVNPAGGHFLSSLFSLLSFLCSLPSSLLGADPFLCHTAGPEASQTLSVEFLLFKTRPSTLSS